VGALSLANLLLLLFLESKEDFQKRSAQEGTQLLLVHRLLELLLIQELQDEKN
jgi:hypothetical protein